MADTQDGANSPAQRDPEQEDSAIVSKRIGGNIRARRRWLEMSQQALAVALGVSQEMISKFEAGTYAIRAAELPKLARLLGVPVSYFFDTDQRGAFEYNRVGGSDWLQIEREALAALRRKREPPTGDVEAD